MGEETGQIREEEIPVKPEVFRNTFQGDDFTFVDLARLMGGRFISADRLPKSMRDEPNYRKPDYYIFQRNNFEDERRERNENYIRKMIMHLEWRGLTGKNRRIGAENVRKYLNRNNLGEARRYWKEKNGKTIEKIAIAGIIGLGALTVLGAVASAGYYIISNLDSL